MKLTPGKSIHFQENSGKNSKIIIICFTISLSLSSRTCAIVSTQGTYEADHISLLRDSTMSFVLNFCFLYILLQSNRKISY